MSNRIQDERIISESNRIYRICFYILCGGIYLDLIVKFNLLYSIGDGGLPTLWMLGLETLILLGVFYINIFMLAKRGIAFGATDLDTDRFPKRRYALVAGGIALVFAIGMWTLRICTNTWEYGVWNAILFLGLLYLLTFAFAFAILYFSFWIVFRIAKKNAE